jgi:hypothetical protein
LFRLFPSKSDLVWDGLKEVRDAVRLRAGSLSGAGLRLGVIIDELFVPILRPLDEPEAASMARRRLRLTAGAPALFHHATLVEIEEVITTAIAASVLPLGTPPALVASTLVGATFAALLWWAEHGEGMSALEAMRAALNALALADGA